MSRAVHYLCNETKCVSVVMVSHVLLSQKHMSEISPKQNLNQSFLSLIVCVRTLLVFYLGAECRTFFHKAPGARATVLPKSAPNPSESFPDCARTPIQCGCRAAQHYSLSTIPKRSALSSTTTQHYSLSTLRSTLFPKSFAFSGPSHNMTHS